MAKENGLNEVDILRFFETGPIEKAEVVFNIVREKMRERLKTGGSEPRAASTRKTTAKPKGEDSAPGLTSQ